MNYLLTGGCGFIGSWLAEHLIRQGHSVIVLDDLSTGKYENIGHLEGQPQFRLLIGSVLDSELVRDAVRSSDAVFHLASAVGVKLIMERPLQTIQSIFNGTENVLTFANRFRKPVLFTSTSEVYGKSTAVPFQEDGDRLSGPTHKQRWAYACAKALDEFLALAYWKENRLPVVVTRLFNTVGPKQTGQYGMVIPNFVQRALADQPILVHGDGTQSRCFGHVADVVEALATLIHTPSAYGEVVNVGSSEEISINDLAQLVTQIAHSKSAIEHVSYEQVFGEGFEDMQRRVPSIEKVRALIGWGPKRDLRTILTDVVGWMRSKRFDGKASTPDIEATRLPSSSRDRIELSSTAPLTAHS